MGSWVQTTISPLFIPPAEAFTLEKVANCPFSEEVIYSSYHDALFVRAPHTLYRISMSDSSKKIVYATEDYEISDLDISENGELALLLLSDVENSIKVLDRDIFTIKMELTTTESIPSICKFAARTSLLAGLYVERLKLIRFVHMDWSEGTVFQNGVNSSLPPISLLKVEDDNFLSVTGSGQVYSIRPSQIREEYVPEDIVEFSSSSSSVIAGGMSSSSVTVSSSSQSDKELESSSSSSSEKKYFTGVKLIHSFGKEIKSADLAGSRNLDISDVQSKLRVFVGSKRWSNDRWDSGEVETDKRAIAYGGGNNLEPGQKYYAHILLYYENLGWATPQIQEFIVPKYQGE